MTKTVSTLLCALLVWLLPGQALADPYVGYFAGDLDGRHYQVEIARVNATTYDGILRIDDDRMQLDARRYGEHLHGRLSSHTGHIGFNAQIQGGILVMLIEDARRIVLRRGSSQ